MKVIVTGSAGLIGSAIRRVVNRDGIPNFVFLTRNDLDLIDSARTAEVFREIAPTHVIHAAGLIGGVGANLARPADFFYQNAMMNTNVIHSTSGVGAEFIGLLSTCIFPDGAPLPLESRSLHFGPPHSSNAAYAYAKRMIEVQCRAYKTQEGLNYKLLIPTNGYGPQDNFDLLAGHAAPALLHKLFRAQEDGLESIPVWGSGNALREFVFSEDIARIALATLDHSSFPEEPVIVSHGKEASIRDFLEEAMAAFGMQVRLDFDTSKPEGQFRKPSDLHVFSEVFSGFEFTELSVGIRKTVDWMLQADFRRGMTS